MSNKAYLSRQYRLLGITSNDLFTDEESLQLNKIGDIGRQLDQEGLSKEERKKLTAEKKAASTRLRKMFSEYPSDKPRILNPHRVCRKLDGEYIDYIDLTRVKDEYIIQEFENEWSRCNDIEINTFCPIKLNLKWNIQHGDLLKQAFINGIEMTWLNADGELETLHFDYFTAAAGQMRTDRCAFVEHNALEEHWNQLFAGMTPEIINAHGGINLNKISAYIGLVTGASERWELENGDFLDIDRVLVVPDIKSHVTCEMDHIDANYKIERGVHTEKVNQCDGVGWFLPRLREISKQKSKNKMIRGPWIKGLVTEFDFIEFCRVNNTEPVVVDFWGQEHDLVKENILMVLTDSQLKLAEFYDSMQQYRDMFHKHNSYICATNYEEDNIGNSELNYQFLQTLIDATDDEINGMIADDYKAIQDIGTSKDNQLAIFCSGKIKTYMQKSLLIYPELLRDGYFRTQLKEIKKARILDAQSGKIHPHNKRLYVVPDPYAAWERIALGIAEPKGIIKRGEIWTAEESYNNVNEVDMLRSPHLYIEHCIRTVLHNRPDLKKWFNTSAVYTSFDDIASRILQFDFDGDELNLIEEPNIIAAAKRTIANHNILPLFYDAQKAPRQKFTIENRYDRLMNAHKFGGAAIGGVSNTMTKLWNSIQDIIMAARICCYNNFVIDAAKTGEAKEYPPEIAKPINQLSHGRMPWFFQFTPNGRRGDIKCCSRPTDNISIMNKIALRFEKLKKEKLVLNYEDVDDFNGYMLLEGEPKVNIDVFRMFDQEIFLAMGIRSKIKQSKTHSNYDETATGEWVRENEWWDKKLKEIYDKMIDTFKDERIIYDSLVMEMFVKKSMSESRKAQFWILFGERAYNNIKKNLEHYHKCTHKGCKMKVPDWDINHDLHHQLADEMHQKCYGCGIIFETPNITKNGKMYCPECSKLQNERKKKSDQLSKRLSKAEDKFRRMNHVTDHECEENENWLPLLQWYYTYKR